jgi:PTH1 family peptidyl-tRNA hydrolase
MRTRVVAGLGNPGPRYEWTRHNAGFWVVDRIARTAGLRWRKLPDAWEAGGEVEGERVVLLKPCTYMNASGEAVLGCLGRHGLLPEELLAVVDDAALPVGRLRLRGSGSAGGHRGLLSVEDRLETRAYPRLRIGVGDAPEGTDLADFVLEPIAPEDWERLAPVVERGALVVMDVLREGVAWAMNRHNTLPAGEAGPAAADPRAGSGTG